MTASSNASLSLPHNLIMTSSLIAKAAIVNHQAAARQGRGSFSETPSDTRAPVLKSTTGSQPIIRPAMAIAGKLNAELARPRSATLLQAASAS